MKQVFFSIALLLSINAFTQNPSYTGSIDFPMTDSVDNGIAFERKAVFECMILNKRVTSIALQFRVEFLNNNEKMNIAQPYAKQIIITDNEFVTEEGQYVGDISKVLELYGKATGDKDNPYQKVKGEDRYDLTTPCIGWYSYLSKLFDNSQLQLNVLIKTIAQNEYSKGKL